jgi:hypothetical protein
MAGAQFRVPMATAEVRAAASFAHVRMLRICGMLDVLYFLDGCRLHRALVSPSASQHSSVHTARVSTTALAADEAHLKRRKRIRLPLELCLAVGVR